MPDLDKCFNAGLAVGDQVITELNLIRFENEYDRGTAEFKIAFFFHFFNMTRAFAVDDTADSKCAYFHIADLLKNLSLNNSTNAFIFTKYVRTATQGDGIDRVKMSVKGLIVNNITGTREMIAMVICRAEANNR